MTAGRRRRGRTSRHSTVERAPSDTRFRERLDEVDPRCLHPLYKALFGQLQRGKGWRV